MFILDSTLRMAQPLEPVIVKTQIILDNPALRDARIEGGSTRFHSEDGERASGAQSDPLQGRTHAPAWATQLAKRFPQDLVDAIVHGAICSAPTRCNWTASNQESARPVAGDIGKWHCIDAFAERLGRRVLYLNCGEESLVDARLVLA